MDTALSNGDILLDGRGYPIVLQGINEILQRVFIKLSVRRGSFIYDKNLGSELYKLYSSASELSSKALNISRDAVADMTGVIITSASAERNNEKINVRVSVLSGKQTGEVAVVV